MNIGFVINVAFPSGMATTNRIYTLGKGLSEQGNNVKVYCLRSTESQSKPLNMNKSGIYNELSFQYTPNTIYRSKYKLLRAIMVIVGFVNFIYYFINDSRKKRYDFLISSTSYYFSNLIISWLCKLFKTKYILAIDEYPHVIRTPERYPNWFTSFYMDKFHKLFDALIVMTSVLIDYYRSFCKKDTKFIHLPMTVEMERFNCEKKIPETLIDTSYFAYCGNLGQNDKDGVPLLIMAFSQVLKKNICKNLKLVIIGSTSSFESFKMDKLKELAKELHIEDNIYFTGKVHKDIIPDYLCNAKALCLARPDNIQAKGGFPTKLGEYLATGKPVVVTKVGEIPKYLDDKSAYLAEPDSIDSFAEKMAQVLQDANSNIIGENGKKVAKENFCYKKQGGVLSIFLSSI